MCARTVTTNSAMFVQQSAPTMEPFIGKREKCRCSSDERFCALGSSSGTIL